jgi:hypothetical protein
MKLHYFFGCILAAASLAVWPEIGLAHGGGGHGGEVEDTLLSVVVVTHLADSPAVALVRDSAGRGDFLLVDFLVAEITAALVTVVSVDAIATFAIVAFAILMGAFSISATPALDIQVTIQITPTITHIRTTTTMGI